MARCIRALRFGRYALIAYGPENADGPDCVDGYEVYLDGKHICDVLSGIPHDERLAQTLDDIADKKGTK